MWKEKVGPDYSMNLLLALGDLGEAQLAVHQLCA